MGHFGMKRDQKDEDMLLRSRIADAAGVPRELLLSLPVLTATGRQEIRVENYRGIQEYTQELIRINTRSGQIRLTGKRLSIEYYTNTEMKITGLISSIEYK